jgi:ADP-ribose pyrophosphatase
MELLHSETVSQGHTVDLAVRRFRRADGSEVERQVVVHPGSVAILAHDEEVVHLVRQPREAVGEDGLLEIPAGTLDVEGETEIECAQRELREEVGLAAEHWRVLKVVYPSPGFLSERSTIFEATGLSPERGSRDAEEEIEVVRLPVVEVGPALDGIRDAKTALALLLLLRQRGSGFGS